MNRDEEFCELAEQITAGLYRRALLVTRDPQLAEDLTQETLTRLYVNFRRVRSQDNPRGYAFTILYRLAIDRSRRRSSHEVPSHELPDPGSSADQTELGLDLTRRLAQLDPELRALVVARYIDDLPGKKISYTYSQELQLLTMEVTDAKGTSWAAIGLDDVRWHPYSAASCRQAGCTTTKVGTATMATTIDTEKVGQGMWSYLQRPDRRVVWFGQRGALDNTLTRPGRLLTQQQVAALLSDPRWDEELALVPTQLAPGAGIETGGPTPAAAPTER